MKVASKTKFHPLQSLPTHSCNSAVIYSVLIYLAILSKKLSEFYQISKFLSNNGTFDTRHAAAHVSVNSTMEFSTRHLACFTPAVQAGWNQFKPVGSSLVHMTNSNSVALPHHFLSWTSTREVV